MTEIDLFDITPKMIEAARLVIMEACDQRMRDDPWFHPDAICLFSNGSLIEKIYRVMVESAVEAVEVVG